MNKDLELGKRIAWLRKYRNLKQIEVAKVLGIAYQSYQAYEYGSHPSRKNLELILNYYNCSRSWLLTGEGEPFPGARQKYPEVCGPPAPTETTKESPLSPPVPAAPYPQEFRVSDALTMTARVLESGTSYATALYLNIQHFDRAIKAEERIAQVEQAQAEMTAKNREFEARSLNFEQIVEKMQDRMQDLEEKVVGLNGEVAGLKEENASLRKENAYLKDKLTKPGEVIPDAAEGGTA